jgi:MFS transporter, ACS family, glucarate transporter
VTRTWFPRDSRTIVQGIVATFCGRLGGALSPIVMATLLMGVCGFSWRMALLLMAGAGVLFGILFWLLFRESPRHDSRVNDAERELIAGGEVEPTTRGVLPVGQALRNRSLVLICVQQLLAAGADNIYQYLLGSFFLERFGVNLATAGLLVSLPMLGGAFGGLSGGLLNDLGARLVGRRWGRTLVGGTGPIIAAGLLLVFLRQPTALAAAVALMAVKFFVDWNQPTVWGACTDLAGRYTATVFSVINTAGTLGGVIFPPLFGLILDAYKTETVIDGETVTRINYDPLFFVIALMYAGSAACWLAIDCTKAIQSSPATGASG